MQVERFEASRGHQPWLSGRVIAVFALMCTAFMVVPATAATLDRIQETGRIRLGYLADARPFTFASGSGAPEGFSAELCQQVANEVKTHLAQPGLTVEWVQVSMENRLSQVQEGNIDLLCTPMSMTLGRRAEVSFSMPVFAGGNRAVLRADSAEALRRALAEHPQSHPVWRGSPAAKVLEDTTFGVVSGTTTEKWLESRRAAFQVDARIVPVADYRAGLQQLMDRRIDVLFGERSVILGAMDDAARKDLVVFDRLFTQELGALALARNDDDFRLLVDRALSKAYAASEFPALYTRWNGAYDDKARAFFQWNALAQ